MFLEGLFLRFFGSKSLPKRYREYIPTESSLRILSLEYIRQFRAFVVLNSDTEIHVAAVDITDTRLRSYLNHNFYNFKITWFSISQDFFDTVLNALEVVPGVQTQPLDTRYQDGPNQQSYDHAGSISDAVDLLIGDACHLSTSDIRMSPVVEGLRIRFRIDGVVRDICRINLLRRDGFISRVKVLAGLRTDEHRSAQDGRFNYSYQGHMIDIRVSIVPTYYGECVVMRLLAAPSTALTLVSLGFTENDIRKVNQCLRKPYGLILSTGPTGSGKTTTLYSLVQSLNTPHRSIVTIEDPVEYAISGTDQIPVSAGAGINFASGLRSILRQDPDILMIGEIRDEETAHIAVNAALTGHLVLSSMHTNNSVATLARFEDLGVASFLLASTINLIISQRLLRRICEDCRREKYLTNAEKESLGSVCNNLILSKSRFFVGIGCNKCNGVGYKGRIGVYEVLTLNERIKNAVLLKKSENEILDLARISGMISLFDDGLQKALGGIVTLEEVLSTYYE